MWLRDNCRCHLCFDPKTHQKIFDTYEIPLQIKPASVHVDDTHLSIKWPCDHTSMYDYKFLWQNIFEAQKYSSNNVEVKTWNLASFPALDSICVDYDEFSADNNHGKRKLVEYVLKFGVGVISNAPATEEDTEVAIRSFCAPKRTLFGDFWTFQADEKFDDSAYSNSDLGPHTDNTYFSEPSRIQIFHCLKAAENGGETLLIDGFKMAEELRKKDEKCYEILSKFSTPSDYIGDGEFHRSFGTVFRHDLVSGNLIQFRYNLYDAAPISSITFDKIDLFYEALHKLTNIIRSEKNQVWVPLKPGQIILIDNWRVMHGRSGYTGSRAMTGCYLDNSDFNSRARSLGFQC